MLQQYILLVCFSYIASDVVLMNQLAVNCPVHCSCDEPNGFVNCSRLSSHGIPHLPPWTRSTDLSYNNFTDIPEGQFELYPHLNHIDISDNYLIDSSIHPTSFKGLGPMDFLDLSYNYMTRIPQHLPKNNSWLLIIHNKISHITAEDFKQFTYLYHLALSFNQIIYVDPSAFAALPDLVELDLMFNNLTTAGLQDGTFSQNHKLSNLEIRFNPLGRVPLGLPSSITSLGLIGNGITVLHKATFSSMPSMSSIGLWQNPIAQVEDYAFAGLDKMTYFDMNSCRISRLTKFSLYGLSSLEKMFLYSNNISEIQPGAFDWFSRTAQEYWLSVNLLTTLDESFKEALQQQQVTFVDLSDNPWHCDCKLRWLKELQEATASRYVFQGPIKCASPEKLRGKEWHDIKASDFVCNKS